MIQVLIFDLILISLVIQVHIFGIYNTFTEVRSTVYSICFQSHGTLLFRVSKSVDYLSVIQVQIFDLILIYIIPFLGRNFHCDCFMMISLEQWRAAIGCFSCSGVVNQLQVLNLGIIIVVFL